MLLGLFGTGRNGSSLMLHLLDGLQDIYVHPVEENFLSLFNDFASRGKVTRFTLQNCIDHPLNYLDKKVSTEQIGSFFENSLEDLYKDYMQMCEETKKIPKPLLKMLLPIPEITVKDFVPNYLQTLAEYVRPDVKFKHCLFKSVETPYIKDYGSLFPDMKFIHIIRHPVAVCSSQKRSVMENKRLPACYLGHDLILCMLSKRWVPHAAVIQIYKNDPRHITVLYEDLVKNPKQEIGRIAGWLGLDPPPRSDTLTALHNLDKRNWGFNPSKKGVETPLKPVSDLQKKSNYIEVLTRREIELINYKTAPYLAEFGYDQTSNPTLKDLLLQYLLLDKWELMHCTSPKWFLRGIIAMLYRRIRLL